ncbi:multicopper oxidase family protein [Microvirga flavescens]|uniref:multicopper oxidase family protein n=1 Tax=Microvirga flavescens TaxID=2249811 RepID=UPI000DD7AF12|nr:multicopper oxidase family protein [Microvirga flavescens]
MPRHHPFQPTRRLFGAGLAISAFSLKNNALASQSKKEDKPRPTGDAVWIWLATPTPSRLKPDSRREAELWFQPGDFSPGVLKITAGEEFCLKLQNRTPKPLSLHWHGVRGENAMDGVGGLTQEPILSGEDFSYCMTPPDPGTFLIRPCIIGGSAEPAERGLTGLLIVEEKVPPHADRDIALLIDDWKLADDGTLAAFEPAAEASVSGRLGNLLTVNRQTVPLKIEAAPGSRIRLRLANACNARTMRLRFDQLKPYVIAIDGQPTDTFEPLRASLPFPPGTRYDVMLDLPTEAGATGSVIAQIGDGMALVQFTTVGEKRSELPPLTPLPENKNLPTEIKLQNAIRKDVTIEAREAGTSARWTINGKAGTVGMPPLAKVRRGAPVVLTLTNNTPLTQPFHLHGHVFRLLHALDDGWEPYWLDTVQVPENRTIRIAFIADNPGKWLLASTVMERFDAGLWTWIEVG